MVTNMSGAIKPLPSLGSKSAVGLAAMVSSRDFPDFLALDTRSRMEAKASWEAVKSALEANGPWPGMILVESLATDSILLMPSMKPLMLPPVE